MHLAKNKLTQFVLVLTVLIVITVTCELLVKMNAAPHSLFVPPSEIAKSLLRLIQDAGFWKDTTITFSEVLLGFAFSILVAIIIGTLISQFLVLELSFMPYVIGFQAIPSITLAPIFHQWFGPAGLASKIALVFAVAAFPIIMMVITGLQSSKTDQIQMLRSFGASRLQILTKVQVPNALPYFFAGLRMGIIMAITGAVVAEFQGAEAGLGYRFLLDFSNFRFADAYAAILALSFMGIFLHTLIGWLRTYVVFWVKPNSGVL
jgi:ABC-type nitrate/sulfonate/bicarbonate transport system, permease component